MGLKDFGSNFGIEFKEMAWSFAKEARSVLGNISSGKDGSE